MTPISLLGPSSAPLAGARIWLSGSLPETDGSSDEERRAILDFVRRFAKRVFQRGGHIVHGSHPTFTPTLLSEARLHQEQRGRRDCLTLAVSRFWSKKENVEEWRKHALVYETEEVSGERAEENSLEILRLWMASRSDAIVAVGGRWWSEAGSRAGLPIEVGKAVERGIPCFLLGGLGGAARGFVAHHPEIFTRLKNGLTEEVNRDLSTKQDVASLAEEICDHLERLPLVRGRGTDGVSFRILALDGGGIKGTFTAAALAAWEKHTGLDCVKHFDLIAGTSTGGIIAIGLGLGMKAQQMLDFYRNRGSVIFPLTRLRSRLWHTLRHILLPKYSQKVLLRELATGYYGDGAPKRLRDSCCRLVIPTYHAVAGASHLFRTPHHPDLTADAETEAAQAALATAAAPTFFPAAKIATAVAESSYFDGGVWANSPAMAAIIEAVCFLRVPLERIDVLSVGTTEEPFTARLQTRAGIIGWLWKKRILELLMNVQQESSLKLAEYLVETSRFQRVNFTSVPGSYSLDGVRQIDELADLGNQVALQPKILAKIKSRFLNGVSVVPWQPYSAAAEGKA